MLKYIAQAFNTINKNSPLILQNNTFYYKNRLIDCATRFYSEDPKNFSRLYEWYKKDIISDKDSAMHHGCKIGDCIGYIHGPKTKKYYNELAKIKRIIKSLTSI